MLSNDVGQLTALVNGADTCVGTALRNCKLRRLPGVHRKWPEPVIDGVPIVDPELTTRISVEEEGVPQRRTPVPPVYRFGDSAAAHFNAGGAGPRRPSEETEDESNRAKAERVHARSTFHNGNILAHTALLAHATTIQSP